MRVNLAARCGAELVGTFFLVLIGPGTAVVELRVHGAIDPVGVALAFGCVLIATIYALGHLSGAHFNPAVSIAFAVGKRLPRSDVLPYVGAQLVGALLAASALRIIAGRAVIASATVATIATGPALLLEILLTLLLMLVIMAVATDARVAGPVAGIAVGLAVCGDALMGGPLTGASMNPARSFGPAAITGQWSAHWIYWVGPIAGAVAAVYLYEFLRPGTAHDHRR